jgi:pilus assembly protein CpaE
MTSESNVVLMTKEKATAELVSSALGSSHRHVLAGVCKDFSELRHHLSRTAAQAVVVDIDPYAAPVMRDLSVLVTANPETRVVIVSSSWSERLILDAMQAGARHFLRKSSVAEELDEVLERLLCEAAKDVMLGEIIPVFSAGGGCGATTVAVNLANELRLASSKPVLAIDLDTCYGTLADYLGIKGQYGIADVLHRNGVIDRDLVQSIAYGYMDDFHVLLSPAGINGRETVPLQFDNLSKTLEVCKQVYGYTVLDAPRIPRSVALGLAAMSRFVLIVFQLTVKDLKTTRSLVSFLSQNGVPSDRVIPLANRVRERGPLVRMEDSRKVLGLDSVARIRNDWRSAMKSLNRGLPLARVAGWSGLRRDFRKLAAKIHNCTMENNVKVPR